MQECTESMIDESYSNGIPTCPLITRLCFTRESLGKDPERISTPIGEVEVYTSFNNDNKASPVLLTFHDIGLNSISNFSTFFDRPETKNITKEFDLIHVNAPGQNFEEKSLPKEHHYPNMESLSEMVEYICHYYGISSFVGMGIGLGANILVRLAFRRPKLVNGLILMNCNISKVSWMEWVFQKLHMKSIEKHNNIPEAIIDHLLWYHLGPESTARNLESILKHHFKTQIDKHNLTLLLQAYYNRSEIKLARELAPNGKTLYGAVRTLKVPVLNIVGNNSPHVDATVDFNGKLDPKRCTWMKIQDAGMVIEEQPLKVAEAMKLFLQGLGYNLKKIR